MKEQELEEKLGTGYYLINSRYDNDNVKN